MGKYFEIEKDGKTYKLSFTRRTVTFMENNGFDVQKAASQPALTFEHLVRGGLKANHPTLKESEIKEITDYIDEEYGLMEAMNPLMEMYKEVFQREGKKKKIVVKG